MELLFEILFEIYCALMMYMVPEKEASTKNYRTIAILIATAVLFSVIALFIWGIVLLIDYNNKLGVIPIIIASVISIAQIIAGFILHNKKSKK